MSGPATRNLTRGRFEGGGGSRGLVADASVLTLRLGLPDEEEPGACDHKGVCDEEERGADLRCARGEDRPPTRAWRNADRAA